MRPIRAWSVSWPPGQARHRGYSFGEIVSNRPGAYLGAMNSESPICDLSTVARDNEGFLLDPQDWTDAVARAIAAENAQPLDDRHWHIIRFIRDYYERTATVPEARKLLRYMRDSWGDEQGTRKALYHLFPTGYGQTACKIAGMRKPLKLMLDV